MFAPRGRRTDCAKRITVNGETVDSPAFNVEGNEKILLDGEKLPAVESTRLWLYYKPTGLLTTHKDTSNRPTVFDNLPAGLPRVISVGRLDLNSEGLLLLTNNGELSRTLELPQNGWSRRYKVKVHGRVSQAKIDSLADGVTVDGVAYGPVKILLGETQGTNTWLTITLQEGKNREIRRLMKYIGLEVARLIRLSYGPFQLGSLKKAKCARFRKSSERTARRQIPVMRIIGGLYRGKNFFRRVQFTFVPLPIRRAKLFLTFYTANFPSRGINFESPTFLPAAARLRSRRFPAACGMQPWQTLTSPTRHAMLRFFRPKNKIRLLKADAARLPAADAPFDLIFLDAPYHKGLSEKRWLRFCGKTGWPKTLYAWWNWPVTKPLPFRPDCKRLTTAATASAVLFFSANKQLDFLSKKSIIITVQLNYLHYDFNFT